MITHLARLSAKDEKMVVGLMSGTSVDGIDAALVRIRGHYTSTHADEIAFTNTPFPPGVREQVFALFDRETSSSELLCHMNFLLGELFAEAAIRTAYKAGLDIADIDLIGSHGQTVCHYPTVRRGFCVPSTLQIGEGAVIAHKTGVLTISDFRVADVAAGGLGAPLVPYTEFLLEGRRDENIALLNIGGIANITVIPQNAAPEDIIAFDTGPGNMVIDHAAHVLAGLPFDCGGALAAQGAVNESILAQVMDGEFFQMPPPKATGREHFGKAFGERFISLCQAENMTTEDTTATATALTAEAVRHALKNYVSCKPAVLVVGGGGAYNHQMMRELRRRLEGISVMTREELGKNSDSKEAVAFAVLANESLHGNPANLPAVTGAAFRKVLGKISLP